MAWVGRFFVFLVLVWTNSVAAQSDVRRIALVVGNAAYEQIGRLDNPGNDAGLIGGVLENAGFEVDYLYDATQAQMESAIVDLGRRLRDSGPDTVGLFYYAGHGVQSQGKNFLLPVDAALSNEAELDLIGVQADIVLRQMETAKNRTNIVILDSCRNNPFAAIQGMEANGLAKMNPSPGTFLSYATGPGDIALDGLGRHSPFSAALADAMSKPDLAIEQVFKDVRVRVVEETRGIQTPWDTSLLTNDFAFFEGADIVAAREAEGAQWAAIQTSADPLEFTRFLRAYPDGRFAAQARRSLDGVLAKLNTGDTDGATRALRLLEGLPNTAEKALLQTAFASGDLADYQAYITEFPKGIYAELIALEIDNLQ